ncbi:MAG: hypothetical protein ACREVS_05395 [Burkholderiales bacterium]
MSQVLYLFAVSLGLATALASISIWSPRALWIKVGALAIAALFLPATYVSVVDLLSRPKPVALEWKRADLAEARVIGADLREGEGIYLWLRTPGVEEPRAYVLPWDQKLAEQLHGAQREAQARGTAVHARNLFEGDPDRQQPLFYAPPQPALPPKEAPAQTPFVFESQAGRP